jgi:hypothetical protein
MRGTSAREVPARAKWVSETGPFRASASGIFEGIWQSHTTNAGRNRWAAGIQDEGRARRHAFKVGLECPARGRTPEIRRAQPNRSRSVDSKLTKYPSHIYSMHSLQLFLAAWKSTAFSLAKDVGPKSIAPRQPAVVGEGGPRAQTISQSTDSLCFLGEVQYSRLVRRASNQRWP